MKVTARFPHGGFGFYDGQRRRDGDMFDIVDDHFSPGWMVEVEEKPKRGRKPKEKEVDVPEQGGGE